MAGQGNGRLTGSRVSGGRPGKAHKPTYLGYGVERRPPHRSASPGRGATACPPGEQARERELAGDLRHEGGWPFTTPTGDPLNPNTDYHQWKELLKAAGLRAGRLHDARHTAAAVLLILGVPERTVMGIMGSSSTGMTRRYQHVRDAIRQSVAEQVDGLLWGGNTGGAAEGDRTAADAN
jgi:integrase